MLDGVDVANNSKLTTLTYHGVNVAGTVGYWSAVGGRWGNYASGLTSRQLDNLRIAAGSNHWTVMGVDLSEPGTGGAHLTDNSGATDYILCANRPNGAGLNGHCGS